MGPRLFFKLKVNECKFSGAPTARCERPTGTLLNRSRWLQRRFSLWGAGGGETEQRVDAGRADEMGKKVSVLCCLKLLSPPTPTTHG